MLIEECTIKDVPLLAKLNKLFFEEEKSETNLSLPHLEARMSSYLSSHFGAFLFRQDDKIVGYALCDKSITPVYLRQFFISREERRKGYGSQAFRLLLDNLDIRDADIEVYYWNDIGSAFWKSLGFDTQSNRIVNKK